MRKLASLVVALLSASAACLPLDTRPEPGSVLVTMKAAPSTIDGVSTTDGWKVTFERVLVVIGRPALDGDNCEAYGEADYFHLFDGRLPTAQKLAIVYGLHSCTLSYRVRNADSETVLGAGITEEDRKLMRTGADDPYTQGFGVSILLRGSATKSGVTKRFDWSMRRDRIRYEKCSLEGKESDDTGTELSLSAGDALTVELQVHAETVLQNLLLAEKSQPRFDPIALADDRGNGDGNVTLEELDKIPLSDVGVDVVELGKELDVAGSWKSLGELVYDGLMPRMIRPGVSGRCSTTFPPEED